MQKILFLIFVLIIFSCKKEDENLALITLPYEIQNDSLILKGEFTSYGNQKVLQFGFNLIVMESVGQDKLDTLISVLDNPQDGKFELSMLNSVDYNITYYIRAYAKTSDELHYGNQIAINGEGILSPQITDFSPMRGVDGDAILINGLYFGLNNSDLEVFIGSKKAEILSVSNKSLLIKIPDYEYREECLISIIQEGITTYSDDYFLLDGPYISSFSPQSSSGEVVLNIKGENFSPIAWRNKLLIAHKYAEIIEASDTTLTAKLNTTYILPGDYPLDLKCGEKSVLSEEPFSILSTWEEYPPLPVTGFSEATVFEINNNIYVCTGSTNWLSTGGYTNNFYKYNIDAFTWTQLPDFPGGKRAYAAAFVIGSMAYFGTGAAGGFNDYYEDFWEFNSVTEQWTQLDNFPGGESVSVMSFEYEGKGYFLMGGNSISFYCFDAQSNTWTQLPDFPDFSRGRASYGIINGHLYIIGGSNSHSNYSANTWSYNFETQEWAYIRDVDEYYRPLHSFTYNNKIYMLDRASNNLYVSHNLYEYNPVTDEVIKELHVFPGQYRHSSFGIFCDQRFYFGTGGVGGHGECTNDFWSCDFSIY